MSSTEIVQRHSPDVLCLQECDDRALPEFIGDLHLSDATARNRLGLAVYHRNRQFTVQATRAFELKRSLYDRVAKPAHERLIAVRLRDEEHDRELVVASFHAAPLTALNSLRRKQIHAALAEMQLMGPGLPVLMVGDYNYPVFKAGLSDKITASGYDLTLSDSRTYTRYKVFRGHFDLATSVGLTIESVDHAAPRIVGSPADPRDVELRECRSIGQRCSRGQLTGYTRSTADAHTQARRTAPSFMVNSTRTALLVQAMAVQRTRMGDSGKRTQAETAMGRSASFTGSSPSSALPSEMGCGRVAVSCTAPSVMSLP